MAQNRYYSQGQATQDQDERRKQFRQNVTDPRQQGMNRNLKTIEDTMATRKLNQDRDWMTPAASGAAVGSQVGGPIGGLIGGGLGAVGGVARCATTAEAGCLTNRRTNSWSSFGRQSRSPSC